MYKQELKDAPKRYTLKKSTTAAKPNIILRSTFDNSVPVVLTTMEKTAFSVEAAGDQTL